MPNADPEFKEWYSPTLGRILFALLLALGGFWLPQEVPLVWYPLNEPGDDILYLEIKCAADGEGDVKIYENLTHGINELDTISWPIAASENTYTYVFPLPDAPITELRLDPPAKGVALRVDNLRITDRRGKVIRQFPRDAIVPQHQIASLNSTPSGWEIRSTADSFDPYARIEIGAPIVAREMTPRNALRCALSSGYLAGMLWLILLAVLFTFWRPHSLKDAGVHLGYMALLAGAFALVGNRGLIRNSWHYSQFTPPPPSANVHMEMDLTTSIGNQAQIFWDTGNGISEADSHRATLTPSPNLQTLYFPLPAAQLNGLRLDPGDEAGSISIREIRIVDDQRVVREVLDLKALTPAHDIAEAAIETSFFRPLKIVTTAGATDPVLLFSDEAVAQINRAKASIAPPP